MKWFSGAADGAECWVYPEEKRWGSLLTERSSICRIISSGLHYYFYSQWILGLIFYIYIFNRLIWIDECSFIWVHWIVVAQLEKGTLNAPFTQYYKSVMQKAFSRNMTTNGVNRCSLFSQISSPRLSGILFYLLLAFNVWHNNSPDGLSHSVCPKTLMLTKKWTMDRSLAWLNYCKALCRRWNFFCYIL